LQLHVQKRGNQQVEVQPEFRQVGRDLIIGSASLIGGDGRRQERFQLITLCEGRIVDLQGCRTLREAERSARRRPQSPEDLGE
jgi:hypothetical protein